MDNKQNLRSLTRRYFLQQKFLEVIKFILILFLAGFIPSLIGYVIFTIINRSNMGFIYSWLVGALIALIILGICLLTSELIKELIKFIKDWIKSNWRFAEERAKVKLEIIKRGVK